MYLPLPPKYPVSCPYDEGFGVAWEEAGQVEARAMLERGFYREGSLKQVSIFLHSCAEKVGIIRHVFIVNHFTPHSGIRDLLYSYAWNLHEIIVTVKSIYCHYTRRRNNDPTNSLCALANQICHGSINTG